MPESSTPSSRAFDGKAALVTGAGSGIGKAAAIELARQGAAVAVLSKNPERVQATVDAVQALGAEALPVVADVISQADLERAVAAIDGRWGHLDAVVINAGANGVWAPIDDLTLDEWNWTIRTNLTSTFLTTRATVPLMKRGGKGSIAIVASVNGTRIFSNTGATAYSCSKAGQVAFMKMTALELAKFKIRVNAVCPGWIETNIEENTIHRHRDGIRLPVEFPQGQHPLEGHPGSADQVARVMAFLLSDAADHISGTEMWVDGAESLLIG
ncbi:MAG: SDR family NAD(P)-dependent oxidoreductase [Thermomicrobiales bacterium]